VQVFSLFFCNIILQGSVWYLYYKLPTDVATAKLKIGYYFFLEWGMVNERGCPQLVWQCTVLSNTNNDQITSWI